MVKPPWTAPVSNTVNVAVPSASLTVTSAMERLAASLSAMVTVAATGVPSVVLASPEVMPVSVAITVSLASTMRSSFTFTSMVAVVLPAGMVTDPERAM